MLTIWILVSKSILKLWERRNPESLLNELHKTFATLTQEEQKIANLILHDIQNGEIEVDSTLTLRDYINDYQVQIHYDRIKRLSDTFGLDEELLRQMMSMKLTEITLNEFGRFDLLKILLINRRLSRILKI